MDRRPVMIVLNVTHSCNFRCAYCYYSSEMNSNPGTMSEDVLRKVFESVENSRLTSPVNFVLHGGEPLMLNIEYFRQISKLQEKLGQKMSISNYIQTNGYLLNSEFIAFLKQSQEYQNGKFFLGVSVDGPATVHDNFRKLKDGKPTHQRVVDNIKMLDECNIHYGVLSVLSERMYDCRASLYSFYKRFANINELDLLLPHDYTNFPDPDKILMGKLLFELFVQWFEDKNATFRIRLFMSILSNFIGFGGTICSFLRDCLSELSMLNIDIKGKISPCDSACGTTIGSIYEDDLDGMFEKNRTRLATAKTNARRIDKCVFCQWYKMCYGGCPTNSANDGRPIYCADYYFLFSNIHGYLESRFPSYRVNIDESVIEAFPNPKVREALLKLKQITKRSREKSLVCV